MSQPVEPAPVIEHKAERKVMRRAAIVLALAAIALLAYLARGLGLPTPQTLGAFFDRWATDPYLAPRLPYFYVGFVAVCAASTFPRAIIILAATTVFGGMNTVLLTSLGGALGAGGAFLTARYVARDFVQARIPDNWHKWEERISRNGFTTMFVLRSIPFSPMSSPHWGAGLTSMRFLPFFFGILLGFGPSTVFYVLFSEAVVQGYKSFFNIPFAVPMMIVGQGLIILGVVLFYRNQRAKSQAAQAAEERINENGATEPAAPLEETL